jgi:hypothetical protein
MQKLTKQQFCYLANRREKIKRKRKAIEAARYDEPQNSYLKPWTKGKRGVLMDYIREAIESLKDYNALIVAEKNLTEQITALLLERDNLRATSMSLAPGKGYNEPDDRLANNIFQRRVLSKNLRLTKKRMECMDRAFATLEDEEGLVLNRIFVLGGKNAIEDLRQQLAYERTKIYELRNEAIKKFAKALYGVGTQ